MCSGMGLAPVSTWGTFEVVPRSLQISRHTQEDAAAEAAAATVVTQIQKTEVAAVKAAQGKHPISTSTAAVTAGTLEA
jgi:hypothetical protein